MAISKELAGKRILVTGAARGIGFAAAECFVSRGAHVAIADIDASAAHEASLVLGADQAMGLGVDISSEQSVIEMFADITQTLGGLDGIFNNAGIIHPGDGDISATAIDAWQATLAVNLTGVYLACKHGIEVLRGGGGGAIVNNASIVAMLGSSPSQIAYTAAKGGVVALSRELGVAFARERIRINAISPGVTATGMAGQFSADATENRRKRLQHIPLGRYAEACEIGEVAAFLLSDRASYITAHNWPVDGGMTAAYLCPE